MSASAAQRKPAKRAPIPSEAKEGLRRDIVAAWHAFRDAAAQGDKAYLRQLHIVAKAAERTVDVPTMLQTLKRRSEFFKPGYLIDPRYIEPELILVEPRTVEEDLFRIARAFWSMPYSKGYGRRLRYVVFDRYHEAVIGIIGLQSPPADLACRDELIKVPRDRKLRLVNSTLDAYTIGAIPPYSHMLGGKLVAGFVATDQVRRDYWRIYGARRTEMRGERLAQPLIAVTTTSAFGRSSIYNRLRFQGRTLAEPIGYTKGFGTIHLEALYPRITSWLESKGEFVSGGYGVGPRVRWQNICNAFYDLDLTRKYLEHGLRREVFIFRHIQNLEGVCERSEIPNPHALPVDTWASHWKERWALPRAQRDPSWLDVDTRGQMSQGIRELQPPQG